MKHCPHPRRSRGRCGVAAVEFAICLPVLAILFLGALESCGGIFQQYSARATLHELAKIAMKGTSKSSDVQSAANQYLQQQGFTTFDIDIDVITRTQNVNSVDPPTVTHFDIGNTGPGTAGLDEVPRGTLMKMTLTMDRPSIPGLGLARQYLGNTIECDCVFVKEL